MDRQHVQARFAQAVRAGQRGAPAVSQTSDQLEAQAQAEFGKVWDAVDELGELIAAEFDGRLVRSFKGVTQTGLVVGVIQAEGSQVPRVEFKFGIRDDRLECPTLLDEPIGADEQAKFVEALVATLGHEFGRAGRGAPLAA